jgi:site-specific DNA recombinase
MNDIQELFSYRKKRQGKINSEAKINTQKKKDVYGVLIRVSTDRQAEEGDSVQMQQERAMEIIKQNNGILHKYYIEEGVSASKNRIEDRPQLQELLEDVEAGIVNKIIAYKRDRLTRVTQDWLRILEICAKNQCDIIFSSSGEAQLFNDPVYGKVFESILASIAEMESANTSMRVRDTMASVAAKGKWTGGRLPYGYKRNERGQIELIKECVPVIQEIEDLYLAGYGIYSIVKWLNGAEVNNLGRRPNGAAPKLMLYDNDIPHWSHHMIEGILFNPFYAGIIEYSVEGKRTKQQDESKIIRVKGDYEACRTIERQKQIYQMKEKKSLRPPRTYNTTFLLTGLVYCGVCKEPYRARNTTTSRGKRYGYYACSSRENLSRNAIHRYCRNVTYRKETLEACIIDGIKKRLSNLDMLKLEDEIIKGLLKGKDNIKNQLAMIEKEIRELEKEESSLLKLMKRLDENNPNYDLVLQKYEEDYVEVIKKINNLKKAKIELEQKNAENLEEYELRKETLESIKNFAQSIDLAPDYLKKSLIDEIVERIDIYPDGKIDITFNFNIEVNKPNTSESEDTDNDKFINFDSTGERVGSLIINSVTLNIAVPTIITININEWRKRINKKAKRKLPEWIKKIAGKDITSQQLHLDTGLSESICRQYLKGKRIPSEQSFLKIANAYNTTIEDFLKFADINLNAEVFFDKTIQWGFQWGKNNFDKDDV